MNPHIAARRKSLQLTSNKFYCVITECCGERIVNPDLQRTINSLRRKFWEPPCCGEFAKNCNGVVLRLGDVRLVERIDAKDDASDRGGNLPAHELAAKINWITEV